LSLEWRVDSGVRDVAAPSSDILVVLPSLGDRPELLERALHSIDAQRRDVNLSLVMVVPASKRSARALSKKFGAVMVSDPGGGMSAAINAGLSQRSSEQFYIWIGDDDQFRPGGLATLKRLLEHNPYSPVAYGGCDYVDDDGRVLWVSKAGGLASSMLRFGPNLIPHLSAMMRLDALEAIGGYDESLRYTMDLDVLLRLKKHGTFVSTTTVTSAFGWQPSSLTVDNRSASANEARAVKRRYVPAWLRWCEPLWAYPVAWASAFAAHRISAQTRQG
jgi:GT2 family glycosyltransferase